MKLLLFSLFFWPFSSSFAFDPGPVLVGGFGSVVLHEAGHAAATTVLGGEVLAFRPFPTVIEMPDENGVLTERWVLGYVKSTAFTEGGSNSKNALVASAGSLGNLFSVLALAPLLPRVSSGFGRDSLDQMLFFSCFDWPSYVAADLLFSENQSDWGRVASLTEVSLGWYMVGSLASSLIVNQYREHWRRQASYSGGVWNQRSGTPLKRAHSNLQSNLGIGGFSSPNFSLGFSISYQ